jgi:hypothetical protein
MLLQKELNFTNKRLSKPEVGQLDALARFVFDSKCGVIQKCSRWFRTGDSRSRFLSAGF